MYIILLGAPGVGKGTQAKMIMEKHRIPQISTGEILRQEVSEATEVGRKAEAILKQGELVPDDIILDMVGRRLRQDDCQKGFILDGFPRTIPQARGLDLLLKKLHIEKLKVIEISVSEAEIIKRLTARRICSKCGKDYNINLNPPPPDNICVVCGGTIIQREDDKEETIKNRLQVYRQQTEPLIAYYQKKGNFYQVNGEDPLELVHKNIENIIK